MTILSMVQLQRRGVLSSESNFTVKFIPRQVKEVACYLARASRFYASFTMLDFMPGCIATLLLNEA